MQEGDKFTFPIKKFLKSLKFQMIPGFITEIFQEKKSLVS